MLAQAKADNAVIHGVTTVIDADGNASVTCGGMTRTSGSKQNSTTLNAEKEKKKKDYRKSVRERKNLRRKGSLRDGQKKRRSWRSWTEDETFTNISYWH